MISRSLRFPGRRRIVTVLALALVAGAATMTVAEAQSAFPDIALWSFPGAYQAGPDSILERPRTITLRWVRDPAAEARPDFGGYRIYRVINAPDTARMVLIRRFSLNIGDSLLMWHFPRINASTPASGRIVTFLDPDSSGSFFKVCRQLDSLGRCASPGDSILKIVPPPGPHDGFRTWYAITYEARNVIARDYQDLFIPDTLDSFARCGVTRTDRDSCPNLNHKGRNVTSAAVEPTSGPLVNLQRVAVVPNPFRAAEAWDLATANEVHFINLPAQARIRIFTAAGDLVADLQHSDPVRDFERWDLKNGAGAAVSSGIYVYRVESGSFSFQNRFVVIR